LAVNCYANYSDGVESIGSYIFSRVSYNTKSYNVEGDNPLGLLLNRGIDPKLRSIVGKILTTLIEGNLDIDFTHSNVNYPNSLFHAISNGIYHNKLIHEFFKQGGDILQKDEDGATILKTFLCNIDCDNDECRSILKSIYAHCDSYMKQQLCNSGAASQETILGSLFESIYNEEKHTGWYMARALIYSESIIPFFNAYTWSYLSQLKICYDDCKLCQKIVSLLVIPLKMKFMVTILQIKQFGENIAAIAEYIQ